MNISAIALSIAFFMPSIQPPQPEAPKPGTASIVGRVVAADTGRPLRGATLRLVSYEVMRVAKSTVTDAQGRFEFTGLLAGRYTLTASAERRLGLEFGQRRPPEAGRPIDLREGERFDAANFSLPRMGAIEGRLLDEFGDPAPNVLVQISRADFIAGRRRLLPLGNPRNTQPTDDKGRYRVSGLAPGDYYVTALSGVFTEQNETGGFAPTYYPGTMDAAGAKPVRVAFGQDVTNLSFALVPARMARVSGVIVDAAGLPTSATIVLAVSDRAGAVGFNLARAVADRAGTFVLRNVPPGVYTIQAFGPSATGALGQSPFGWLPVTTNGEDVSGLMIKVAPGVKARGQFAFEGAPAPAAARSQEFRVSPRPVEFDSAPVVGGGPPPYMLREDWTFEVGNMSGLRVIRADVSSPGWSLKRITLNGRDVTDTPLDFSRGDIDDLEIVLTSRGASVSGGVTNPDGTPSSNYSVVIFAADRSRWTFPSRFVALGRPNQDGRFNVRGLPPHDYKVVALTGVEGTEWQDPEFLEKAWYVAAPLSLSEGENKTIELTLTVSR